MKNLLLGAMGMCFFISGCTTNGKPTSANTYELVWAEEFDGDSIDTDVWKYWEGTAYNNELQYYTSNDRNAYIKDGKLYIEAQKENYKGSEYTSARISTDSTHIGWKKGRFEARIKLPEGKGFWPAFWLMPIEDSGWPKSGEIDIMEYRGNEPSTVSGAIHFWKGNCEGETWECRTFLVEEFTINDGKLSSGFHLYALEWTDEEFIWYLDDHIFQKIAFSDFETEHDPFTSPFYVILNLAVGGDFLPNPDETTVFPQAMVVDYIRVYQKSK